MKTLLLQWDDADFAVMNKKKLQVNRLRRLQKKPKLSWPAFFRRLCA